MKLLIVEDDAKTSQIIVNTLAAQGIVCDIASSGREALKQVMNNNYQSIILDLNLPDINGYEILLRMRTYRIKTPVIILSSNSAVQYKIRCINNGADDYIIKPFNCAELLSRIKAVCRRSIGEANAVYQIGALTFDFDKNAVFVGEKQVNLTTTELSILEFLIINRNIVIPSETLLNYLRQSSKLPHIKIINVFICKIRDKLTKAFLEVFPESDNPNHYVCPSSYISTEWGKGYSFKEPIAQRAQDISASA